RVYKFKMVKQLTLLGYSYEDGTVILELIALGSHENFYRDVKKLF
ncbi:type II toxin-antitoxin system RelE/ParE family toxin, partial [Alteromonas australica]|nr:type II toxin-antitoxin system RelE/ParE family toxin [Pseudomonadota bacterium]